MSVPSFADLGKSAREVFKMGYHYGKSLVKVNAKASSDSLDVGSLLSLDCDQMKLNGSSNLEYKTESYGTFLERWGTDGTVMIGISQSGIPVPDVGMRCELTYNPETTDKGLKIGATCVKENVNAACSVSTDLQNNVNILGSIVTAIKGLIIGYQGGYSTETNKMTKNDVGLAFSYKDVQFHLRCNQIPYECGVSILYKINAEWETAMNYLMARGGNNNVWALGAGARYKIDDNSWFRAKFNSDLQLGMSLQQKLDNNVSLTLSLNFDCTNVPRGGHKVGLAIDIGV